MAIICFVLVWFVFEIIVFNFTLGPWATQSSVLSHTSRVGYGSFLMESRVLRQIR